MSISDQVLPLVGVVLGAGATYALTMLNERKRHRQETEREWRERKIESYLDFLEAVKRMRLISAQMAATLDLDDEADPVDLDEGVRRLADANADRGTAYERVNLCGDATAITKARDLSKAAWGLEWIARQRHPDVTPELWIKRRRLYAAAVDDFIEAIRADLKVPGEYPRREFELEHIDEQRHSEERVFRRRRQEREQGD
jgi:hypothetical protein